MLTVRREVSSASVGMGFQLSPNGPVPQSQINPQQQQSWHGIPCCIRKQVTLDEIKTLLHEFGSPTLSALAGRSSRAKLKDLDELSGRIQMMRRVLKIGLQCGRVRVEECPLSPAEARSSDQTRNVQLYRRGTRDAVRQLDETR